MESMQIEEKGRTMKTFADLYERSKTYVDAREGALVTAAVRLTEKRSGTPTLLKEYDETGGVDMKSATFDADFKEFGEYARALAGNLKYYRELDFALVGAEALGLLTCAYLIIKPLFKIRKRFKK